MKSLVMEILYQNKLACPECGESQIVKMLALETPYVYQCDSCKEIIQAKEGVCCIYCQHGEVKCPSEQARWN